MSNWMMARLHWLRRRMAVWRPFRWMRTREEVREILRQYYAEHPEDLREVVAELGDSVNEAMRRIKPDGSSLIVLVCTPQPDTFTAEGGMVAMTIRTMGFQDEQKEAVAAMLRCAANDVEQDGY